MFGEEYLLPALGYSYRKSTLQHGIICKNSKLNLSIWHNDHEYADIKAPVRNFLFVSLRRINQI